MKSWYGSGSVALCALSALILAGCDGVKTATQPTAPTATYQLTVTAPASGAGTITSSPAGISCPGTCSASFAANTQVTLTEKAGANYFFGGWSGSCTGTGACAITLTAAATVSAVFNAGDGLTVALAGTGTGTVTSSAGGISCVPACSASFAPNTQVTLTAAPTGGSTFTGWSGGGCSGTGTCSVTVASSESVTATFAAAVVIVNDTLTVTLAGTGQGTVSSNPAGINCTSGTCTGSFPANTQIILTETPGANSSFTSWSGCTGTTTCTFTLTAAETITATFGPSNPYAALSHIILFAQENRSLDHYFGYMRQYWADNGIPDQPFNGLAQFNPPVNGVTSPAPTVPGCAAGTWSGSCSPDASDPIVSFHLQSVCMENQSPFWNEAHNQWDYADPTGSSPGDLANPPLDGFAFTAAYDAGSNGFMDLEGVRAMGYYDGTDLNYYYFMASNFATSDSWFAPIMSRTQLNRMYLLAATSHGQAYPIGSGCPPAQCAGSTNTGNQLSNMTIFEELQNAGISWKIYVDAEDTVNKTGQSCSAMTGNEESACLVENSYINEFQYENTILNNPTLLANVQPLTTFQSDAANNTLPQFALIEPASDAGLDEHPSDSDEYPVNVQSGQAYAAKNVINQLMQSPLSWANSALIFTYDEWGGLYDHVPPQPATAPGDGPLDPGDPGYPTDLFSTDICGKEPGQLGTGMCTFSWTGYRVPMIVISPFAKQNYVSHDVMDTTAVLAMVEDRFGLSPLTNRDASYNSEQTKNATMAEFFDFTNPPWMTPPANVPTPSTGGQCSQVPPAGAYGQGGWGEPVNLSVAVSIPGGTIVSSPPGISCNTDFTYSSTDVCGYVFPSGTVVTLTETPNSDTFLNWTGEDGTAGPCGASTSSTCTITLSTDEYVQANFNQ